MTTRRVAITIAFLGVATSAGACSNVESGTPSAHDSAAPSGTTSSAVAIPQQLDLQSYTSDPCALLPEQLLSSLRYAPEGDVTLPGDESFSQEVAGMSGPYCGWKSEEGAARTLTLTLLTSEFTQGENVFSRARELHSQGALTLWEELDVSEYPAAYWGIQDNRQRGDCALLVAVSDQDFLAVSADMYLEEPESACLDVESVTKSAIDNLREGS
ncbi:DUF3558 domain-containing protein [Saccharomonospora piscinae]|uniref:DUF3558 family protein n=1 Tax=Saccharomonospora piscinae TaxID=687388 RepID=UPI001105A256|nr:DUF3558 family protein [Saccharomonospora piscinae]TLW91912.1 DUF3558 domain-containing protein [Saccharomonospora piscinae]